MGLIGLMGLLGCSEEQAGNNNSRLSLEAVPCASMLVDEAEKDVTRAWVPPSPYFTYDNVNSKFLQQKDLVNKTIDVFFTQDGQTPLEGSFSYKSYDHSWRLNPEIELNNTPYHLYGYIPKEDAGSASVSPNSTYENGAVLTINGLNAVTPSDVCVIIGAKDGNADQNNYDENTPYKVRDLAPGKFDIQFNSGENAKNYFFLLFDHLYSALRFRFTVHPDYAALRTIKLRKLELTSYQDKQGTGVKAKYNATITLQKNNNSESPIVGSVVFTPDNTAADVSQVPIFQGEVQLPVYPELPLEFLGCFVPGDYRHFKLRSTYDVYDNNSTTQHPDGNLIRQGCQAENGFDLTTKFGNDLVVTRGHSYSYTITVQPTYLYMLSEPDLDNPSITIDN